jgi:hypothetical protein
MGLMMFDAYGQARSIRHEDVRQVQRGFTIWRRTIRVVRWLLGAATGAALGAVNKGQSELSGIAPAIGLMAGAFLNRRANRLCNWKRFQRTSMGGDL